jgi:hypothetical protein
MELRPSQDESQLPTAEGAVHDLHIVDSDLGFALRMTSMEVRKTMVVEEHDDGDPKETADRRHSFIMPMASAAERRPNIPAAGVHFSSL